MTEARTDRVTWAMEMARVTAKRRTCLRRAVGCVLLDPDGYILSTGYNGVAKGMPHCNEVTGFIMSGPGSPELDGPIYSNSCPGAHAPSGTQLDGCHAIHAEQNALLQCSDVRRIHTCFVTASPCLTCVKLLMNTACSRIIFDERYPHSESQLLWEAHGGEWIHYPEARSV